MALKKEIRLEKCACGCGRMFPLTRSNRKYYSKQCKGRSNNTKQRRSGYKTVLTRLDQIEVRIKDLQNLITIYLDTK